MQTGTLRRSVARASKGLMVAASVLVAATAVAQMRPMEKFIRVGIGTGPGNATVCGLTDTNLLRCWGVDRTSIRRSSTSWRRNPVRTPFAVSGWVRVASAQ